MYKQKYMKYKTKYLFGGNLNKVAPISSPKCFFRDIYNLSCSTVTVCVRE